MIKKLKTLEMLIVPNLLKRISSTPSRFEELGTTSHVSFTPSVTWLLQKKHSLCMELHQIPSDPLSICVFPPKNFICISLWHT